MSTDIDDDGPPGFVRATPESLARHRAETLAHFREEAARALLDMGLSVADLPKALAALMVKAAAKFDEASAPFVEKVHEHAKRGAAPLH